MFYGQCNNCNERWELGTASTCICVKDEPVAYVKTVIEALYENSDPVSVEAAELLERITTPPQRTWVGLTYEDMTKLQKDLYDAKGESVLPTTFAMAVEAKLKEKNS